MKKSRFDFEWTSEADSVEDLEMQETSKRKTEVKVDYLRKLTSLLFMLLTVKLIQLGALLNKTHWAYHGFTLIAALLLVFFWNREPIKGGSIFYE